MAKKKAASQNKADPMPNEIEATGVIKGTETAVSLSGSEPEARFPIVGIGASAGGLEAFSQFFSNMPADSGIAFVLVQHLSASYKSMLDELVQRYTEMTVHQVEDGMKVEPNQVYIIPPDRDLALLHETLYLIEPVATDGLRHSIDFFFRSLAQDRGEESVGIVLSGTGSDGTLGLREIMGAGGFVMVQDPDSTQYDGMPRSAINTDLVHTILTPDKMPAQLITYVKGIYAMKARQTELPTEPVPADSLHKIHVLLRMHTGHDFSYYKQNTIRRRIQRRMVVNQIERLQDYERYLKLNAEEIDILYKDLLIGVTNFFRDIDAFVALEEQVIPKLFANKSMDQSIRIWCPGCATGEEPYSLAMLLQEYMSRNNQSVVVQIFATDINDEAITQARTGMFAEGIVTDLAPERLQRFFTKENGAYEINKSIRDMVIFAAQNVIFDPPFSKLDLISCRNLLIYLGPELQSKVLSMFHYALNQDGFLFLGNSESIGEHTDIFTVLDRKAKLFQRKGLISPQRNAEKFMLPVMRNVKGGITKARGKAEKKDLSLRELTETLLLTSYTPTAILITAVLGNSSNRRWVKQTSTY